MKTPLLWTSRLIALLAVGLSIYLAQASLAAQGVAGCSWEAFDCDAALGSRWSKWFGLPVAVGGVLTYGLALVGLLLVGRTGGVGDAGWRIVEAALPLAIGAGIWFIALQATTLGSFCLYCLLTHACGAALAVLVFILRRGETGEAPAPSAAIGIGIPAPPTGESTGPPPLGLPTVAGVLGLVLLIGGQLFGPKPKPAEAVEINLDQTFQFDDRVAATSAEKSEPEEPAADPARDGSENARATPSAQSRRRPGGSRPLSLLGGSLQIDAYEHPILGSPEAPHIVVELMDYACPHCRELHEKLEEALERFDGQVAVVVMPTPGEIKCNPYARKARKESRGACLAANLAVSFSELSPERFPEFHHWMLKDDKIPNRTAAIVEAQRHVDKNELSLLLRDPEGRIKGRVKRYIELSGQLSKMGVRGVPAMILGDKAIAARLETVDEVIDLWSKTFGLDKPTVELPF